MTDLSSSTLTDDIIKKWNVSRQIDEKTLDTISNNMSHVLSKIDPVMFMSSLVTDSRAYCRVMDYISAIISDYDLNDQDKEIVKAALLKLSVKADPSVFSKVSNGLSLGSALASVYLASNGYGYAATALSSANAAVTGSKLNAAVALGTLGASLIGTDTADKAYDSLLTYTPSCNVNEYQQLNKFYNMLVFGGKLTGDRKYDTNFKNMVKNLFKQLAYSCGMSKDHKTVLSMFYTVQLIWNYVNSSEHRLTTTYDLSDDINLIIRMLDRSEVVFGPNEKLVFEQVPAITPPKEVLAITPSNEESDFTTSGVETVKALREYRSAVNNLISSKGQSDGIIIAAVNRFMKAVDKNKIMLLSFSDKDAIRKGIQERSKELYQSYGKDVTSLIDTQLDDSLYTELAKGSNDIDTLTDTVNDAFESKPDEHNDADILIRKLKNAISKRSVVSTVSTVSTDETTVSLVQQIENDIDEFYDTNDTVALLMGDEEQFLSKALPHLESILELSKQHGLSIDSKTARDAKKMLQSIETDDPNNKSYLNKMITSLSMATVTVDSIANKIYRLLTRNDLKVRDKTEIANHLYDIQKNYVLNSSDKFRLDAVIKELHNHHVLEMADTIIQERNGMYVIQNDVDVIDSVIELIDNLNKRVYAVADKEKIDKELEPLRDLAKKIDNRLNGTGSDSLRWLYTTSNPTKKLKQLSDKIKSIGSDSWFSYIKSKLPANSSVNSIIGALTGYGIGYTAYKLDKFINSYGNKFDNVTLERFVRSAVNRDTPDNLAFLISSINLPIDTALMEIIEVNRGYSYISRLRDWYPDMSQKTIVKSFGTALDRRSNMSAIALLSQVDSLTVFFNLVGIAYKVHANDVLDGLFKCPRVKDHYHMLKTNDPKSTELIVKFLRSVLELPVNPKGYQILQTVYGDLPTTYRRAFLDTIAATNYNLLGTVNAQTLRNNAMMLGINGRDNDAIFHTLKSNSAMSKQLLSDRR